MQADALKGDGIRTQDPKLQVAHNYNYTLPQTLKAEKHSTENEAEKNIKWYDPM